MIYVVNKKTHKPTENDFYIGRGSSLGNPFTSLPSFVETKAEYRCDTREESISKYKEHLLKKISEKDEKICYDLNKIYSKASNNEDTYLVCYCKPQSCHGDVIKEIIENKIWNHKTYTGEINVDALKENQIAVVGTNTQGRHGKGFALICKEKLGFRNGTARGLCGKAYGIITKDLTKSNHPSRTKEQIEHEIKELYSFASKNKNLEFVVPYNTVSKNLNFYSPEDMANFFSHCFIPKNIVFEKEFYRLMKKIRTGK